MTSNQALWANLCFGWICIGWPGLMWLAGWAVGRHGWRNLLHGGLVRLKNSVPAERGAYDD